MTIVTYSVTPTHRYFMRKTKEELARFVMLHRDGKQMPSYREIDEHIAGRSKTALASEALTVCRSMPV